MERAGPIEDLMDRIESEPSACLFTTIRVNSGTKRYFESHPWEKMDLEKVQKHYHKHDSDPWNYVEYM